MALYKFRIIFIIIIIIINIIIIFLNPRYQCSRERF